MSKIYLDVIFAIRVSRGFELPSVQEDFVAELDYDILSKTDDVDIMDTEIQESEIKKVDGGWVVILTIRVIVNSYGADISEFINELDYEFRSSDAEIAGTELRDYSVVDAK